MNTPNVISSAQSGELENVLRALEAGCDVSERDAHGWTALHWAAGKGFTSIAALLLDRGADPSLPGADGRTPWMIARAAGHSQTAQMLRDAEQRRGGFSDGIGARRYCKAYKLSALRAFAQFRDVATAGVSDDDEKIVYIHQDFTVTASMWPGENLVVQSITPAWKTFCETELGFRIPADLV